MVLLSYNLDEPEVLRSVRNWMRLSVMALQFTPRWVWDT